MVLFLLSGFGGGCATTDHLVKNPAKAESTKASPETDEKTFLSSSEFNIPIVVNRDVEKFIRYFQTSNRRHFIRWLERSSRYIPLMKKILQENNLPTDLVYLAMIESGFNDRALSTRHAVGPWQFIRETGKRYGLRIDWWIDERRDPIKATVAATKYLKDLYNMFNSWFLAAAGYNAGENKIKRAIQKHQTQDFWEMTNYPYLKRETKQYIPKLIAAALIAKNPEKYGFHDVQYNAQLEFDTITIDAPLDLRDVAKITGVSHKEIQKLNPELKRWCTPPDATRYTLKIPTGTKELFLSAYDQIRPKEKMLFHTHEIRRGDTLSQIARRYRTDIRPIVELNNIVLPHRLKPGQRLIIPIPVDSRET